MLPVRRCRESPRESGLAAGSQRGQQENQHMMHDVSVSRLHIQACTHLSEDDFRLHVDFLIGHDPAGFHGDRFGNLQDQVGGADLPVVGVLTGHGGLMRVAVGRSTCQPSQRDRPCLGGRRAIVAPAALFSPGGNRGGEPGGR